jgi:hypothetical protein
MVPIGEHVSIRFPITGIEYKGVIVDRPRLILAVVDASAVESVAGLKSGDKIYILNGKQIHINGYYYVNTDHVILLCC